MLPFFYLISFFFTFTAVRAFPNLVQRQGITALSAAQVSNFTAYAHYAAAAYCHSDRIEPWNCGEHCYANSDFKVVATGGDGDDIQYWFIGYDSKLETVIVAHQGTNRTEFLPVLTDLHFGRGKLDLNLFPGVPSDIEVHKGFRNTHQDTALAVLNGVNMALSKFEANSVTLVGHSLGAALAVLDSVYLPLHLSSEITFQTIVFGLPRAGNKAFADYVDTHAFVTHVGNLKDPIPTTPPKILGYEQIAGEVHIGEDGTWDSCPGHDNESKDCICGQVPTLFSGKLADHSGPYDRVMMKCLAT